MDENESTSLAFLVMLEQRQPLERAVFLMCEVFEFDYTEIVTIQDKCELPATSLSAG